MIKVTYWDDINDRDVYSTLIKTDSEEIADRKARKELRKKGMSYIYRRYPVLFESEG